MDRGLWRRPPAKAAATQAKRADLSVILNGALTLLALIVGVCFAMAIDRYDQRKNYEEAEANAIGTEFARADLLPGAVQVRELLVKYTGQRVLFYTSRDQAELKQIAAKTTRLQNDLWSATGPALVHPTLWPR